MELERMSTKAVISNGERVMLGFTERVCTGYGYSLLMRAQA